MTVPLRDVPQEGIELIKSFEGIPDGDPSTVNLDAYLDPVGIWTIGWGHAITYHGEFLRGPQNRGIARALYPGGITLEQAEMLLRGELVNFARDVLRLAKVPLDDGQFAALVSFAFNCGPANLGSSTLLRKLNRGDLAGAADQFLAWNKARRNGVLVELPGLTRRRRAERAMFLGEDWRAASALRTRGAVAPLRTLAPERPEPPPDQEEEAPEAPAARRPRRPVPKLPVPAAAPTPSIPPPAAARKAPPAVKTAAAKPSASTKTAAGKTPAAPKKAAPARPPAAPKAAAGKQVAKKAATASKPAPAAKAARPRGRTTTP
ncbi:MAG TPA: lysozyme, partial [Rubrivivax sp.]|nr:lysozyme [Rubrivivax sp.]